MTDKYETPDAIQRDIQRTRDGLGQKIDHLQDRLAPREMAGEALDYAKHAGARVGSGLAQTVRENPMPVALIGLGIGWLLLSGRNSGHHRYDEDRPNYGGMTYPAMPPAPGEAGGSRIDPATGQSGGGATAIAERVRHGAAEAGHDIRHRAEQAGGGVRQGYRRARDEAGRLAHEARLRGARAKDATGAFVDRNPLALGAFGLLAGAVIGAALPPSRRERQMIGPYREAAERQADEFAAAAVRDGTERLADAAHSTADRARTQIVGSDDEASKGSAGKPDGSGGAAGPGNATREAGATPGKPATGGPGGLSTGGSGLTAAGRT